MLDRCCTPSVEPAHRAIRVLQAPRYTFSETLKRAECYRRSAHAYRCRVEGCRDHVRRLKDQGYEIVQHAIWAESWRLRDKFETLFQSFTLRGQIIEELQTKLEQVSNIQVGDIVGLTREQWNVVAQLEVLLHTTQRKLEQVRAEHEKPAQGMTKAQLLNQRLNEVQADHGHEV